ncbi:importin alpha [Anaeramoeba flamelloides]|uniref:Importin subunit alpha n=1 Tax=Anaeramoeba flamelloides TaxID=1746091 RepID=A0ABQ8X0E6_9EUKA|nr:importin alpha [Anaeramoeba flamelloides]
MSSSFQKRLQIRKKEFKKKMSHESSRNKRYRLQVQISKNKRESTLQKKRNMDQVTQIRNTLNTKNLTLEEKISNIPDLVELLGDNEQSKQLDAVLEIVNLLTIEENPPIAEIVDSGAIPKLINFLKFTKDTEIKFNSAWAITNITTGNTKEISVLIDNEIIPVLVEIIKSEGDKITIQAVWALGNIASDSIKNRNIIIDHFLIDVFVDIIENTQNIYLLKKTIWAASNIVRKTPIPDFESIKNIVPIFYHLVFSEEIEIVKNACQAISSLFTISNPQISKLITLDFCKYLVALLKSSKSLILPVLRIFGNIVVGSDEVTQCVVESGFFPVIYKFLEKKPRSIRYEICYTLSNICLGTDGQRESLINANLIPILMDIGENDVQFVKKEAIWTLVNICLKGTDQQKIKLLSLGVLSVFVSGLKSIHTDSLISQILLAIKSLFHTNLEENENIQYQPKLIIKQFEQIGGLEIIEKLLDDGNEEISTKAKIINETFFN